MNNWQKMAIAEGHAPQLPTAAPREKLDEIERRQATVFAALSDKPLRVVDLAKITGMFDQTVRVALNGLRIQGKIHMFKGSVKHTGVMFYTLPVVEPTAPPPERYPNTEIVERRSDNEGNGLGSKPLIRIRLPAMPTPQRDEAKFRTVRAQAQQGHSTGENVGVL